MVWIMSQQQNVESTAQRPQKGNEGASPHSYFQAARGGGQQCAECKPACDKAGQRWGKQLRAACGPALQQEQQLVTITPPRVLMVGLLPPMGKYEIKCIRYNFISQTICEIRFVTQCMNSCWPHGGVTYCDCELGSWPAFLGGPLPLPWGGDRSPESSQESSMGCRREQKNHMQ